MKHLFFLLITLVSCTKEIQTTPNLTGLYEVVGKTIVTPEETYVYSSSALIRTDLDITETDIIWYRFHDSEGKMVNDGTTPITRNSEGMITKVGCRPVIEQTDSTITWIQEEDGQSGPWYITYRLYYIGEYQ